MGLLLHVLYTFRNWPQKKKIPKSSFWCRAPDSSDVRAIFLDKLLHGVSCLVFSSTLESQRKYFTGNAIIVCGLAALCHFSKAQAQQELERAGAANLECR